MPSRPMCATVVRRIDAADAIFLQPFYFRRKNGATATTENADMTASAFIEQIPEVFEEFHMTALVRRQRNRLHIFFDGCFGNFMYAAVMPEVNDFDSFGLQNAAHDIDSSIMPVEQGSGCNDP